MIPQRKNQTFKMKKLKRPIHTTFLNENNYLITRLAITILIILFFIISCFTIATPNPEIAIHNGV